MALWDLGTRAERVRSIVRGGDVLRYSRKWVRELVQKWEAGPDRRSEIHIGRRYINNRTVAVAVAGGVGIAFERYFGRWIGWET